LPDHGGQDHNGSKGQVAAGNWATE